MASRNDPPASIEGLQILVRGLVLKPSGFPLRLPFRLIVFQFDVQRGADGTIEWESSPKKARIRSYAFLDEGDTISGRHLWGFFSSPIKQYLRQL